MTELPPCSEVDFKSPHVVGGYAHLMMSLFRSNKGFSSLNDSMRLRDFRRMASEWVQKVERNIAKQSAEGIQQCLCWYDWIYRLAHNKPDNSRFTDAWNWIAFKRMLEGDDADSVHFMRWIRLNPGERSGIELAWYDDNIRLWQRGAMDRKPFRHYRIDEAYSISSFLLSVKQILPAETKSSLQKYLIDNIDDHLNIGCPRTNEAMRSFVMGIDIPLDERYRALKPILKKLSEDECINPYDREAYALDYRYVC